MHLMGKVALVTGGAQGLGKAFSEALLKRGVKVCLTDVKVQQGEATVKDFRTRYGEDAAMFLKCDVASDQDMQAAFQMTKSAFKRLDIVVNNAGISDEKNWSKMIDINLKGVVNGTELAVKHLRKDEGGNGGVIINVASAAGLMSVFFCPVYAASKHGVVGFTRSMADIPFLDDMGLRFVTLCPAFTRTEMFTNDKNPHAPRDMNERMRLIKMTGVNEVETVVEGFMQLLDDETNNGAVMVITATHGIQVLPKTDQISPLL